MGKKKLRKGKRGEECCVATNVQARMPEASVFNECPSGESLRRLFNNVVPTT